MSLCVQKLPPQKEGAIIYEGVEGGGVVAGRLVWKYGPSDCSGRQNDVWPRASECIGATALSKHYHSDHSLATASQKPKSFQLVKS